MQTALGSDDLDRHLEGKASPGPICGEDGHSKAPSGGEAGTVGKGETMRPCYRTEERDGQRILFRQRNEL